MKTDNLTSTSLDERIIRMENRLSALTVDDEDLKFHWRDLRLQLEQEHDRIRSEIDDLAEKVLLLEQERIHCQSGVEKIEAWHNSPEGSDVLNEGFFCSLEDRIGFRKRILFKTPFQDKPRLMVGFQNLDVSSTSDSHMLGLGMTKSVRLGVEVKNVTDVGFDLHLYTWGGNQVHAAEVRWLALGHKVRFDTTEPLKTEDHHFMDWALSGNTTILNPQEES